MHAPSTLSSHHLQKMHYCTKSLPDSQKKESFAVKSFKSGGTVQQQLHWTFI
jgi:hypothetical protein